MKRLMLPAVLFFNLCPLIVAQSSSAAQAALAGQGAADAPQSSAAQRTLALKNARTLCINSESDFLTVSTMERALMMQKGWDQLDLSIKGSERCSADLELDVDRLIFTHIHTYVLMDKDTNVVLASGRVTAFDGIVASGPIAEQIVRMLSAARVPAQAATPDHGL